MADILASDINGIRQNIADVLGTGAASYGYGQTVYSSAVSAGQIIEKSHWDAIRYDIVNVFIHQTGATPGATIIDAGDVITDDAGDAYKNYDYYARLARDNRFDIAVGQFGISAIDTKTTSSTWSTTAESTLTVTFAGADNARYFFNSGGKIRFTTTFVPGASPTQQSNAWQSFLTTIGSQDFGGNLIAANGFYTLTNTYQEYFQTSNSTPYSANNYQLSAKCNVADNSLGTATEVTFKVSLNDAYVDLGAPAPGDLVDGTLTIVAEEIKATGVLVPTGLPFTITGASAYSMSSISVT